MENGSGSVDDVAVDEDGVDGAEAGSVVEGACSSERKTARRRWCSGVGVERRLRGSSRSIAR